MRWARRRRPSPPIPAEPATRHRHPPRNRDRGPGRAEGLRRPRRVPGWGGPTTAGHAPCTAAPKPASQSPPDHRRDPGAFGSHARPRAHRRSRRPSIVADAAAGSRRCSRAEVTVWVDRVRNDDTLTGRPSAEDGHVVHRRLRCLSLFDIHIARDMLEPSTAHYGRQSVDTSSITSLAEMTSVESVSSHQRHAVGPRFDRVPPKMGPQRAAMTIQPDPDRCRRLRVPYGVSRLVEKSGHRAEDRISRRGMGSVRVGVCRRLGLRMFVSPAQG